MGNKQQSELSSQQIAERASSTLHASDQCAKTLELQIEEIAPGRAIISMIVTMDYVNGHNTCQGGIITTLADTAFAHACNSYNQVTVAQGLSIEFVRPAMVGEKLTAQAIEQTRGKCVGVYLVEVRNQEDKLVAIMTGKSFSSSKPVFEN